MMHEISLEVLLFIILMLIGIYIFIRKLAMPVQFYENQEIFSEKLRERINITPDYFGVIKEVEPGDLNSNEGNTEDLNNQTKPEEK